MRARRSRSQYALRWERGRPARHANRARKKPTPLRRLGGGQQLPHIENPPRRHLPGAGIRAAACGNAGFQWAPTLGGECYEKCSAHLLMEELVFQWAPTLGGECYLSCALVVRRHRPEGFNGHPPLGVNATGGALPVLSFFGTSKSFNGHPPLGVNATEMLLLVVYATIDEFQWAPTLGGECYGIYPKVPEAVRASVSMGTHPWG